MCVRCLPTEHQRVHKNSFRNTRAFQDRIGIWKCRFLSRGENRSSRRKMSRSTVENQQQTQPSYDNGSGNRPRTQEVYPVCPGKRHRSISTPLGWDASSSQGYHSPAPFIYTLPGERHPRTPPIAPAMVRTGPFDLKLRAQTIRPPNWYGISEFEFISTIDVPALNDNCIIFYHLCVVKSFIEDFDVLRGNKYEIFNPYYKIRWSETSFFYHAKSESDSALSEKVAIAFLTSDYKN